MSVMKNYENKIKLVLIVSLLFMAGGIVDAHKKVYVQDSMVSVLVQRTMEWKYYGRQRIERRTNILTHQLVTAGKLMRVPRTENNSHDLMIINWRTLLNKDVEQKVRSQF